MTNKLIPIKDGLLTGPLDQLDSVHLAGSRCASCAETSLGTNSACPNCGADDLTHVALGDSGTLFTYTIVRHRPPGAYQGPADFKPFGLGLVELDGVIRVMAPLRPAIEDLKIGMPLKFVPYVLRTNENDEEVVAFAYESVGE